MIDTVMRAFLALCAVLCLGILASPQTWGRARW